MSEPEELKLLVLKQPDIEKGNEKKYKTVIDFLRELNRWQKND
jgi:hypothetical protein